MVFSKDLSDSNADLKVLARMLNLNGANGRNELSTFPASNFTMTSGVPEPSSLTMMAVGLVGVGCYFLRRNQSRM